MGLTMTKSVAVVGARVFATALVGRFGTGLVVIIVAVTSACFVSLGMPMEQSSAIERNPTLPK